MLLSGKMTFSGPGQQAKTKTGGITVVFYHKSEGVMSTGLIYHSQGIRGFQHQSLKVEGKSFIQKIKRQSFICGNCGSANVSVKLMRTRRIQGAPYGTKRLYSQLDDRPLQLFGYPRFGLTHAVCKFFYRNLNNEFEKGA